MIFPVTWQPLGSGCLPIPASQLNVHNPALLRMVIVITSVDLLAQYGNYDFKLLSRQDDSNSKNSL